MVVVNGIESEMEMEMGNRYAASLDEIEIVLKWFQKMSGQARPARDSKI